MILKAIERGVSEERIARALNVDVVGPPGGKLCPAGRRSPNMARRTP
jgi:hypothetical protein